MFVAAILSLALAYAIHRLLLGYPRPVHRYTHISRREAAFLDAAAVALFPADGAIPISGREADLPSYADAYVGVLPPHLRLQIRALFTLVEQATIFFPAPGRLGRRRFSALEPEQRVAVLRGWEESRFFLRRLVFTALRAVLTMGYLGHPAVVKQLGVTPYEIESPVCEADLLYPRVGQHPREILLGDADLTAPSDGTPLEDVSRSDVSR